MSGPRIASLIGALTLFLVACGSDDRPSLAANGEEDGEAPKTLVVTGDSEAAALSIVVGDGASGEVTTGTGATNEGPAPGHPSGLAVGSNPASGHSIVADPSAIAPPLVIFDTDMGPDIDDALALAMLHSYEKLGMIELAAVTVSRNSPAGARYTDMINTFYGRPEIPIGINRGSGAPYFDDRLTYVSLAGSWPNDLPDAAIEDGYVLQRRVLAEAEASGRSVMVIQTGFSGNVSQLLDSPGDAISPRSGRELVTSVVSELSIMAGSIDLGIVEFNVEKDIPSARNLFAKWPGPLALSPFELGNAILYPYASIRSDLNWIDRHPIKASYEFRDLEWHDDAPPFYNMRSWDLTSVIHAIEPEAGYFLTSGLGTVVVDGAGRTTFKPGAGQHYVLDRGRQYTGQQKQRVIDRMTELVSLQP